MILVERHRIRQWIDRITALKDASNGIGDNGDLPLKLWTQQYCDSHSWTPLICLTGQLRSSNPRVPGVVTVDSTAVLPIAGTGRPCDPHPTQQAYLLMRYNPCLGGVVVVVALKLGADGLPEMTRSSVSPIHTIDCGSLLECEGGGHIARASGEVNGHRTARRTAAHRDFRDHRGRQGVDAAANKDVVYANAIRRIRRVIKHVNPEGDVAGDLREGRSQRNAHRAVQV